MGFLPFSAVPPASAGGGQTTVTKIVASSGGDYTTLSAALAAASSGWTIYIRPGTYTETGYTNTTGTSGDITVIGGGAQQTVLNFTTNNLSYNGNNTGTSVLNISGVTITFTSGSLTLGGTNQMTRDCIIGNPSGTTTTATYNFLGITQSILNNRFAVNATSGTTYHVRFNPQNGEGMRVVGNHFLLKPESSGSGAVNMVGPKITFVGNTCETAASSTQNFPFLYLNSANNHITGNYFLDGGNAAWAIGVGIAGAAHTTISGNYFEGWQKGINWQTVGSSMTITGNDFYNCALTCIDVNATSTYNTISANALHCSSTTSTTGIKCAGDRNIILGNTTNNMATGVNIITGGTKNAVIGNSLFGATTPLTDAGTTTTSASNVTT